MNVIHGSTCLYHLADAPVFIKHIQMIIVKTNGHGLIECSLAVTEITSCLFRLLGVLLGLSPSGIYRLFVLLDKAGFTERDVLPNKWLGILSPGTKMTGEAKPAHRLENVRGLNRL
jgi:hypothetical protein